MSITTAIDPEQVEFATATRAVFDASETRVEEIESFVDRTQCEVHLERRGGRTDMVVSVDE